MSSFPSEEICYEGYDPRWILGKDKGPPVEVKLPPPSPPPPPPTIVEEPKIPEPILLKVPFCCQGCQNKIRDALYNLDGLESLKLEPECSKVIITGELPLEDCLKAAKKVAKRSEVW